RQPIRVPGGILVLAIRGCHLVAHVRTGLLAVRAPDAYSANDAFKSHGYEIQPSDGHNRFGPVQFGLGRRGPRAWQSPGADVRRMPWHRRLSDRVSAGLSRAED